MSQLNGIILKGIGGFYYIETAEGVYECKARGLFRKEGLSPVAGDRVLITVDDTGKGVIDEIGERKNLLIRPPVANLDRLLIVSSVAEPYPNILVLDKLIAIAEVKGIEPAIIFTKCDLANADELCRIYSNAGFTAVAVSTVTGDGGEQVRELLKGHICAFTGNSGVGKSSLLNMLYPDLQLATAQISQKLGRGRHTTRSVELYKIDENSYIADTPGFSSLDMQRYELIRKDDLQYAFREFKESIGKCRFTSCSHTAEPDCEIRRRLDCGEIEQSRYDSYVKLYEDVKNIPDWQK